MIAWLIKSLKTLIEAYEDTEKSISNRRYKVLRDIRLRKRK